jgi:hypothetical protein
MHFWRLYRDQNPRHIRGRPHIPQPSNIRLKQQWKSEQQRVGWYERTSIKITSEFSNGVSASSSDQTEVPVNHSYKCQRYHCERRQCAWARLHSEPMSRVLQASNRLAVLAGAGIRRDQDWIDDARVEVRVHDAVGAVGWTEYGEEADWKEDWRGGHLRDQHTGSSVAAEVGWEGAEAGLVEQVPTIKTN